ncbi:CPBP family intramembrane glutamic endopeptidase [Paenibacillus sp. IHBB 10380]|uniref:CPBP family intramembrane glutamic endopeptidase n=1 Tax=Paenibacillus sp. IHBB 10380 TaxID=1566358 RepID=UPI0005CFE7AA|nr:CPBP family intramembrane glutamic endopeptidase [Paenibacillus sp. IHBB 10380]
MKKILLMIGNIALYLGIFYAVLFLLRETYQWEATAGFARFLDYNPAMFMAVLSGSILLLYMLLFRLKRSIWPGQVQTLFQTSGFKRISLKNTLFMFGMGLAGCLFSIGLMEIDLVARNFPSIPGLVNDMMRSDSILFVILGVGLLGPIYEEILFRGLIYNHLRSVMPMITAIIVQAAVYAYFQPSLSLSAIGLGSGIIYAILCIRLSSIWAPIILQTSAMSLIFIAKYVGFYEAVDKLGEGMLYVITIVSLLSLLAGTVYVWRNGNGETRDPVQGKSIPTSGGL